MLSSIYTTGWCWCSIPFRWFQYEVKTRNMQSIGAHANGRKRNEVLRFGIAFLLYGVSTHTQTRILTPSSILYARAFGISHRAQMLCRRQQKSGILRSKVSPRRNASANIYSYKIVRCDVYLYNSSIHIATVPAAASAASLRHRVLHAKRLLKPLDL